LAATQLLKLASACVDMYGMVSAGTSCVAEHEAVAAVHDLVTALAARVGKMIPRRNDARYPMNMPLVVGRLNLAGAFEEFGRAWGLDLCAHGIGMITDRIVCTGDELHVKLPALDGRDHLLPIRVKHTDRLFGNVYRVGGHFLFMKAA
jgi:hypothetical protein